jgi:hypothetical protein
VKPLRESHVLLHNTRPGGDQKNRFLRRLCNPLTVPQEPLLKTTLEQLGSIRRAQFFHHIRPVRFDRLVADPQLLADFAIFEAIPNQVEDLLFPLR